MPNIRASSFAIANSTTPCWKCKKLTPVITLFLPAGFEAYEAVREQDCTFADDDAYQSWLSKDHPIIWQQRARPTMLSYIETLTQTTLNALANYKQYFLDRSKSEGDYYMNHCHHCGMKQGDFYLHQENDAAFDPQYEKTVERISLKTIDQSISVTASYHDSLYMFEPWNNFKPIPESPHLF